ncbi:TIGR03084 family protein [Nonomuraea sp. PA05]|uniref:TIGR03084 family metal-binding protein n=1 Tax=Nonomuraea sp. PA05 TaxID=2604466 RepID=UPI0011D89AFA|nr:TIGR03084 family metal-binding protein [Nonomuraea sp. PA05]TYB68669.1 TIGR03084 family protein [Nonomuraea sp. PA05]
MAELLGDLRAETASFEALLHPLDDGGWERPTPAEGWAIRDQVSHLAWFDDAAVRAAGDPDGFQAWVSGFTSVDDIAARSRELTPGDLHAWFSTSRARSLEVFATLGARDRVPWFGPAMSAASFVTARLMETWAHGQDVADALGVVREPTARLRHVATMGFRARPYSFAVRGLPVPGEPVRVELSMPDGDSWTAGPADAPSLVRGTALDFCLAVTQRIHLSDTGLEITGGPAREWMEIAQCFAGPPGKGRGPRSGIDQGHSG